MSEKPYNSSSLPSAIREVRNLRRLRAELEALLERYAADRNKLAADRRNLAKLAAKGPCFNNPLEAMAVEALRDAILLQECRLNPDGTYVK